MSLSRLAGLLSRKRLLIFDLDGTLVDSSPLHARAFNEAFAPEGVVVDYATIAGLTTPNAVDRIASRAGLKLDPERRAALILDKQNRARALIESELTAIDGSLDFVRRVAPSRNLALFTSASRATTEIALARTGFARCFDPVVTAEDVDRGKPDPEGLYLILAHHGASTGEALVFEDAESGIAAATAAGIDAICIAPVAGDSDPLAADWARLNEALDNIV